MMKSLAEKLGLRFAATDVSALGGGFPNLKLFQHSTPVGEKIQGRADKIFGGVYGDETPIIRFRNIVKGIVDDSTITIFDHHFSKASPKKSQTVIVLQSCTFRTPSITIRPKSQMHDVTGVAATNRIKVTDNSAFNDHYIVETNYSAYSHIIDPELIAELANSPFLWIEACDDVLAICRHGTNADLDEILALLDLGMKVKRNLVKLEAVASC